MARNNKRINKYKTYFDLNRNVKEIILLFNEQVSSD